MEQQELIDSGVADIASSLNLGSDDKGTPPLDEPDAAAPPPDEGGPAAPVEGDQPPEGEVRE